MRTNEYRASPAALDRARLRLSYTSPQITVELALADGIPAKRLRDVAASNKRTAAGRRTSSGDARRLESQASHLLSIAARLTAANDNRSARAAAT